MTTKEDTNLRAAANTLLSDNKNWLDALSKPVDALVNQASTKTDFISSQTDISTYRRFDGTLPQKMKVIPLTSNGKQPTELVSLLDGFLIWTEEIYDQLQKDLRDKLKKQLKSPTTTTNSTLAASPANQVIVDQKMLDDIEAEAKKVRDSRTALKSLLAPWLTPTLVGLSITQSNPYIQVGLAAQLKALATYSDGLQSDVTTQVVWSVDKPALASVTDGLVTPKAVGTVIITAVFGGKTAQTSLAIMASQNLFLDRMIGVIGQKDPTFSETQRLFERRNLELSDTQIEALTSSWGKVIKSFTESTASSVDDPQVISDYLQMHASLQTLYDRLTTHVLRLDEANQFLQVY